METETVGRVLTDAKIENLEDLWEVKRGRTGTRRIRSSVSPAEVGVHDAVRLMTQERDATVEVMEVPDGTPVLIGQIPWNCWTSSWTPAATA